MAINVSESLVPSTVNTPLDARYKVASVAAIADIPSPYVGMIFEISGTLYKVNTLKSKTIGVLTVENAQVDTYEQLPTRAEMTAVQTAAQTALTAAQNASSSGVAVNWLTLQRPTYDGVIQLTIKRSTTPVSTITEINELTTIFDSSTATTGKIYAWNGNGWTAWGNTIGSAYDGADVCVDLTGTAAGWLYYKWGTSDWLGIPWPTASRGGGYGEGETGASAGFGTVTASVTTLNAGSSATVNVVASGPNTAKNLIFNFGIPKGDQGIQGPESTAISQEYDFEASDLTDNILTMPIYNVPMGILTNSGKLLPIIQGSFLRDTNQTLHALLNIAPYLAILNQTQVDGTWKCLLVRGVGN